jgi:Ca-activated chloride channel homolog
MALPCYNQARAPFVTWKLGGSLLQSSMQSPRLARLFGLLRASNDCGAFLAWFAVKIWEWVGMKYTKYIFCISILTSLLVVAPALAQSPSAAYVVSSTNALPASTSADDPQDSVLTIRKRVDEVNVLFIATDKHGKFVRNLNQNDFSFLDDHKPVQSIVNFRRETDLPLKLGLLIDVSGSVHTRFEFEQDAATSFMQHVLRPGFDKAFVMGFNSSQELTQDFTDSVPQLSRGVRSLRDGGGTALYDAIYRACRDKLLKEQSDRPQRKALILLSDGDDNQSEVTLAQAVEMAQRAEVIIYAISTDDSGLILRGDKNLEKLAAATGGRAFFPFKMKDIKNSFAAIEDELRSQYVVSYHPADFDPDGRYRSIEISALKKDLQVRARKGYYAPRQ